MNHRSAAPFVPFPDDGDEPSDDPIQVPDAGGLSRRRFVLIAGAGLGVATVGATTAVLRRAADAAASTTASTTAPTTGPTRAGSTATTVAPSSTTTATSAVATPTTPPPFGLGDVSTEHLTIVVADGYRQITTASMPDHAADPSFRYAGAPSAQNLSFRVTTTPAVAAQPTMVRTGQVFGVDLDSVVFDPTTAGYYGGARSGDWNENADQLDVYGAHTRPDGFYHYHAVTDRWVSDPTVHSPLVGWAADGFPIYLRYGFVVADDRAGGVRNLASSYRLRSGNRPSGSGSPGGTYDGRYVADYEYVAGLVDLDECNGRQCVTPEFPDGVYAYFLTDQWPYVPHWIKGTPDASFAPGKGGGSAPRTA